MSDIAAALLLFSHWKKQNDPVALVLIHLLHSWQYLFCLCPMVSPANSAKWITPWDLSGGLL